MERDTSLLYLFGGGASLILGLLVFGVYRVVVEISDSWQQSVRMAERAYPNADAYEPVKNLAAYSHLPGKPIAVRFGTEYFVAVCTEDACVRTEASATAE